jgi:hypothetical protein
MHSRSRDTNLATVPYGKMSLPIKRVLSAEVHKKSGLDHRFGQIIMTALFPPLEKGD